MTKDDIIAICKTTHQLEYDYSLIKDTKRVDDKIDVICPKHGVFHPRLSRFLKGSNCPYCIGKGVKTTESFKNEYIKKYNIYDLHKFTYINAHTPSIAICEKHGEFNISPTNLLNGVGCPKCKIDVLKKVFSSNTEDFIYKSKLIHGDKYDYSLVDYINNDTNVMIKCNICGETFEQSPHNHLSGKGCPYCNKSKLESELKKILDDNKIDYIYQKKFDWLGYQSLDFYLPKYNIAIECQGKQHFDKTIYGNTKDNIKKDLKKNQLCISNKVDIKYLINQSIDELPTFYNENNTIDSINGVYTLLNINPILNDLVNFFIENNINYNIINNEYIKINNLHIYPILNNHIFKDINECNTISIENEKQGIKTMWIKQYEWNNENKQNILKSFILTDCGIIKNRIFARKCYVKEIDNNDIKDFLIKNSMYGFRRSSVVLGLFEKTSDELVMVCTFGHAFYGKGKYDIEVIRVATKIYTQVIGGASKLWKFFIKNYPIIKIGTKNVEWKTCVYYVDFDHNNGKSLHHLGFNFSYYTEGGFHNYNKYSNKINNRNPNKHNKIMELIKNGTICKIQTSGTKVYVFEK